jgi:hypothetical protein
MPLKNFTMCTAKGRKCSAKIVRVLEKKFLFDFERGKKRGRSKKEPGMQ